MDEFKIPVDISCGLHRQHCQLCGQAPNLPDDLSSFLERYLDYLENAREEPPAIEALPEEQRPMAESFIHSIRAARGIDPYASRPSIEQLLAPVEETES